MVSRYNVTWNTPSANSWGSMPAGNGDIGSNVWVTPDGVLHVYISKTDAVSENGRLLKVGKIAVKFKPNVLSGEIFKQELDLHNGIIQITTDKVDMQFLVDANHPAILITGESDDPVEMEVTYEGWRNRARVLSKNEVGSAYGVINSPDPIVVEPDTMLDDAKGILWCHHNERSIWKQVLEGVDLGDFTAGNEDPLLYRTFGASVFGENLMAENDGKLVSVKPAKEFTLNILALTEITPEISSWRSAIEKLQKIIEEQSVAHRVKEHAAWWNQFWNRHYIFVDSEKDSLNAFSVTQAYQLQRYMNACSGRGNLPIKFNGSIFNVDLAEDVDPDNEVKGLDADYRRWGGGYWWQNTRLPYWGMLYSGDHDMMIPLFKMYMDALDFSRFATKEYFNHNGAHFPETMYFWGTYTLDDYGWGGDNPGWPRKGVAKGIPGNSYIQYYWQGALELTFMMQEYYKFTEDKQFLKDYLLPFAKQILTFYDQHYQLDDNGKCLFSPSHSLETYWIDVINPLPEIAGLKSVTKNFLDDDALASDNELRNLCQKISSAIPEIPYYTDDDGDVLIAPAEKFNRQLSNAENPELYAVFPYPHFGLKRDKLDIARKSFKKRKFKQVGGWQQTSVQAALLGLTNEAQEIVTKNFNNKHKGSRFPVFWGPNADWIPDQDHGSVNVRALQNMIIQEIGDSILVMPSWPDDWNVNFKMYASGNTMIEGKFVNGGFENVKVVPAAREKDLIFMNR